VYEDGNDTRIGKKAFSIIFVAKDIDKIPEDDQSWIKKPDLHCILTTESRLGVFVNGIRLPKSEPGQTMGGRLYSGDEITVVPGSAEDPSVLKFVCEFFHGEARQARTKKFEFGRMERTGRSGSASKRADRSATEKSTVAAVA
jgi:hypothetical protein